MIEGASNPQWFMLIVQFRSEKKVMHNLQLKGYEVLLPARRVTKQWTDRIRTHDAPLFPSRLFCRFPPSREHQLLVCSTPGVFSIYEKAGKPFPIPDSEINAIRLLANSSYPMEVTELPIVGDVVLVGGDIRGVLVERSNICRVAIGFGSMGQTIVLKVPLDALRRTDGSLTHHWSLNCL